MSGPAPRPARNPAPGPVERLVLRPVDDLVCRIGAVADRLAAGLFGVMLRLFAWLSDRS